MSLFLFCGGVLWVCCGSGCLVFGDVVKLVGVLIVIVLCVYNDFGKVLVDVQQCVCDVVFVLNWILNVVGCVLVFMCIYIIGVIILMLDDQVFVLQVVGMQMVMVEYGIMLFFGCLNYDFVQVFVQVCVMLLCGVEVVLLVGEVYLLELFEFLVMYCVLYVVMYVYCDDSLYCCIGFDNCVVFVWFIIYLFDFGYCDFVIIMQLLMDNDCVQVCLCGIYDMFVVYGFVVCFVYQYEGVVMIVFGWVSLCVIVGSDVVMWLIVVICGNDVFVFGVLFEVQVFGIDVFVQLLIIGFDDIVFVCEIQLLLMMMWVDIDVIGCQVVYVLFDVFENGVMGFGYVVQFELCIWVFVVVLVQICMCVVCKKQ